MIIPQTKEEVEMLLRLLDLHELKKNAEKSLWLHGSVNMQTSAIASYDLAVVQFIKDAKKINKKYAKKSNG